MRTFYQQYLFEHRLFFRNKVNLFWNFLFPLIFLLLFGTMKFGGSIDYTLPGIITMALFTSCVISSSIAFVLLRDQGFYRRVNIVPVKKITILGAQILQRYILVIIQMIFLVVVALIVFSASIDYFKFEIFILISAAIFSFLSMGFMIASFSKGVEVANIFSMLLYFGLLFLGGTFWPLSVMPDFLQTFASFLPTTYFVSGIKDIVMIDMSIFDMGKHFLVILVWGVICLGLAIKFFRWE
jgi:ABC-2 type transport system permease protein